MRKYLHIIGLLLILVVSCRGPRMIPKDRMTDIYYDMLLVDQQIREDPVLHRQADTMLVYEAVFNRYGYDTDDYLYSVRNYLKDPERFAKILEDVADRFKADARYMEKVVDRHNWIAGLMGMKRPPVDSILAAFSRDSLYLGLPRVVRDSSAYGGWFRLEGIPRDTLTTPADTLITPTDTLTSPTDTL